MKPTFAICVISLALLTLALVPAGAQIAPRLTPQNSGSNQLFIAVSAVNSDIVWAAGTAGTFMSLPIVAKPGALARSPALKISSFAACAP